MQSPPDDRTVRRKLDTDVENPAVAVAETVADVEDRDPTSLANTYDCIDDMLYRLFSNPPSPEARLQVSFDYEGYRITVDQDGDAEFVPRE